MAKQPRLPIKMDDLGLSAKELRFVGEYCTNNFDGIAAMRAARLVSEGASNTECRLRAMELLNQTNVNTAVNRFVNSELDPHRDKFSYQLLNILKARFSYDPSTFFNSDGSARPLDQIPLEWRQAIDAVEVKHYGKEGDVLETVYKLADKPQAMKSLIELLNRRTGGDSEELHSVARSKLDEIFRTGMIAGATVERDRASKKALPEEPSAVPAKEFLKELKQSIKAGVSPDA